MDVVAVIVAAGRGSRAGGGIPKQYRMVGGRPVLAWTVERFLSHPAIGAVLCAIHPDDRELYEASVAVLPGPGRERLQEPALGGATRQVSVLRALEGVAAAHPGARICLVHDGARPFVDAALVDRAIENAAATGAAIPGVPVTDTVKRVDGAGRVVETLDRVALRAVQTPQAFAFPALLKAHRDAAVAGEDAFTDDAKLAEWAGLSVKVFEGDIGNMKLTHPSDFAEAERRFGSQRPTLVTRVSTGFDVHVFGDGDHVWLGGVRVPHSSGVVAHSDGDVVLHALTDALLGVLGDGDIGTHFPPTDPEWRGAASDQFLAFAARRVREAGGRIDHLDATILCERPKVGPHRDAMRARIAEIAGIPVSAVSVKATTTEQLGFTGRGEGLAAMSAATVRLPAIGG